MDIKSKILLWVLIIIAIVSVGFTYYKTVVLKDFEVINTASEEEDTTIVDEAVPADSIDEVATSTEPSATSTAPEAGLPSEEFKISL